MKKIRDFIKKDFSINTIILIGIMIICIIAGIKYNVQKYGTIADWFSGVVAVFAFFVAVWDLKETKEEFRKSKESKLRIDVMAIVALPRENNTVCCELSIMPVNVGLGTGIYRYLGLINTFNKEKFIRRIKKNRNKQLQQNNDVNDLASMLWRGNARENTDQGDIIYGSTLIYPINNEVFESIPGNTVGKIIKENLDAENFIEKLNLRENPKVVALYADPSLNIIESEEIDLSKAFGDI